MLESLCCRAGSTRCTAASLQQGTVVQDELAANITEEQGKTLADAKGDVFRGLGEWGRPAALTSVTGCMLRCLAKSLAGSPLRVESLHF